MMKVLIAYANGPMKYSLKQLGIQARYIKQIDKVVLYTPKDLPPEILNSPLMKHSRGGGYWVWKPYIIWKTLQDYPEGTKVCYADAGCSVYPGEEWNRYWQVLDRRETLLFQYAANIPRWGTVFGCSDAAVECWTKKVTVDFFDAYLNTTQYHRQPKIWGGLVFCKGRDNKFIREWLDLTLSHPELVCDPTDEELKDQYPAFSGLHRHDQSVLTPLAYKYRNKELTVMDEIFDENKSSSVIFTSRNRVTLKMYLTVFLKYHLQGILGISTYNRLKARVLSPFKSLKERS